MSTSDSVSAVGVRSHVASSANTVRVNPWVGLVGHVRVVRASGVTVACCTVGARGTEASAYTSAVVVASEAGRASVSCGGVVYGRISSVSCM